MRIYLIHNFENMIFVYSVFIFLFLYINENKSYKPILRARIVLLKGQQPNWKKTPNPRGKMPKKTETAKDCKGSRKKSSSTSSTTTNPYPNPTSSLVLIGTFFKNIFRASKILSDHYWRIFFVATSLQTAVQNYCLSIFFNIWRLVVILFT